LKITNFGVKQTKIQNIIKNANKSENKKLCITCASHLQIPKPKSLKFNNEYNNEFKDYYNKNLHPSKESQILLLYLDYDECTNLECQTKIPKIEDRLKSSKLQFGIIFGYNSSKSCKFEIYSCTNCDKTLHYDGLYHGIFNKNSKYGYEHELLNNYTYELSKSGNEQYILTF